MATETIQTQTRNTFRITERGNLVGLESPNEFEHLAPPDGHAREGYLISYIDPGSGEVRVLYDLADLHSTVFSAAGDFSPDPLHPAPPYPVLGLDDDLTITATVRTLDNLFRLSSVFYFHGRGSGAKIAMELENISNRDVFFLTAKRDVDVNTAAFGQCGNQSLLCNVHAAGGNSVAVSKDCPECPDGSDPCCCCPSFILAAHTSSAGPAAVPVLRVNRKATPPSEVLTPNLGGSLGLPVLSEDVEITAVWVFNHAIPPGAIWRVVVTNPIASPPGMKPRQGS